MRARVGVEAVLDVEHRLQTTAEIFDAAHAKTAAGAVEHVVTVRTEPLPDGKVDTTVKRYRRLRRRGARERAEHSESEQRFFHCDYLLG